MARRKDKKKERTNHMLSLTIARSISEIIKLSVDDEFRERSFNALGVISTKEVENEIYKKLLASSENPNSLVPQAITSDNETENQPLQKNEQTHPSENISQSQERCEVFNEYKQEDFSQTIYSQIYSEISQDQEERRLRKKDILLNTNSEVITPQINETLFSNLPFKH